MEPSTGLKCSPAAVSARSQDETAETSSLESKQETLAALQVQIRCLQQLVSELLLKNERLRQALVHAEGD
jgi:septal ring factor EnvC (AmiA/AmiB activator)